MSNPKNKIKNAYNYAFAQVFIIFLIMSYTLNCMAQKNKVIARVNYTMVTKKDTSKVKGAKSEEMVLFVAKDASLFTSKSKINYELSQDQKMIARSLMSAGSGSAPVAIRIDRSGAELLSKTNYTNFLSSKKSYTIHEIFGQRYVIESDLPVLKWSLNKDTTNLSGIHCQQATAIVDEKKWTAWFAPTLPFSLGPWKLQGLPGLILHANCEDDELSFVFSSVENATETDFVRTNDIRKRANADPGDINPIDVQMGIDVASALFDLKIILPNYRSIKVTETEFNKLKAAYEKDPRGFSKALNGY